MRSGHLFPFFEKQQKAVVPKFYDGICLKELCTHGYLMETKTTKENEPRFILLQMYSNNTTTETEQGRLLE